MLQQSLRAQILVLLGGSLAALLLIALACFGSLTGDVRAYRELLGGPVRAAQLIDEANLQFRGQVQEWKNVLLRGRQAEAQTKYWSQFEAQERAVQDILGRLGSVAEGELKDRVERLREEHRRLGTAYRQGRQRFLEAGADPIAGDQAVTGIDRATTAQMQALRDELHQASDLHSSSISAEARRTMLLGSLVLIGASLAVALLSLWLVNRNLVRPVQRLIEHIAQLSHGDFGERIEIRRKDELGKLALAANTLRDFLVDIFDRLRRSTRDLDSASGSLNAIASLMAAGTREQFSRTDQVATAMQEMSATAQEVARYAGDKPAALDHRLIAAARQLEASLGLRADYLHTHAAMPRSLLFDAEMLAGYERFVLQHEERHRQAFDDLLAAYPEIAAERRHLLAGYAEQAIPDFVRANDIDLLLMGAVARGHLDNALIGQTAERVLEEVECDLLVLKPTNDI